MGMAAVMYCTTYYYSTGGTGVEYDPETGLWTETAKINDNSYKVCYTLGWDDWGGGWPGDFGGGGGTGGFRPGASKDDRLGKVTEEDCALIREILAKAKTDGQSAAAKWAFDNGKIVGRFTNNTANNYGNMMPTKYGGMDFDWYVTMSMYVLQTSSRPVNMFFGHLSYIGGKSLWEAINLFFPSTREGSYRFEVPYLDPGERVAASAFASGATFADLFDQAWFDKYCGGK
jgi:hypothetical protein